MTDWKLSNGVRVVVKPTDFKADEVLIQAFSPGGTSLVSDADYVEGVAGDDGRAARRRGDVRRDRTRQEARGQARRRATSASAALNETISAGGSPRDLETILQLDLPQGDRAAAGFEAAFNALRAQFVPLLANRDKDPDQVFQDTVVLTMQQNHPRAQPLTAAMLQGVAVRPRVRDLP